MRAVAVLLCCCLAACAGPVAAVPPASPPAQVVIREPWLVFFAWGQASLTRRAHEVLSEIAVLRTRVTVTGISIYGHTDSSGTVAGNRILSLRRARAVAAELVRDGVPAGQIAVEGVGEDRPLIPTPRGMREAQNRRVEVVLTPR